MDQPRAHVRFYAELNDHLRPDDRQHSIEKPFHVPGSVKDMIESFGVPHSEVELITANGESVPFSYIVRDGDRIAVYPKFNAMDSGVRLRRVQPGDPRFVLDVHLGRLAAYLRMIGFDTTYRNCFSDPQLVKISSSENRILLTRDRGLLMHNAVIYGYFLRQTDSHRQLAEVVEHFDLGRRLRPFTRCMACNGLLAPISTHQVAQLVPPRTLELFDEFSQCRDCRRVYWKGSHYRRMLRWISELEAGTAVSNFPIDHSPPA